MADAATILADSARKVRALRGISGTMETSLNLGGRRTTRRFEATFARPNRAHLEARRNGKIMALMVSDGTVAHVYDPGKSEYRQNDVDGAHGVPVGSILGTYFLNPRFGLLDDSGYRRARIVGGESIYGVPTTIVETFNVTKTVILRLWIAADGLPRRSRLTSAVAGRTLVADAWLLKVVLNPTTDARTFVFVAPPGARLFQTQQQREEGNMIGVGKTAPGFTLLTSRADSFWLNDVVRANRATLVNFWFLGCPPCRTELPQLQSLYARLKSKGFAVVAVNVARDSDKLVNDYFARGKFSFPSVTDGTGKQSVGTRWGVSACPTNYLLDKDGRVLFRSVGYDEAGLRGALKTAGLL